MKKVFIIFLILITSPAFAEIEVPTNDGGIKVLNERSIKKVETFNKPTFGINIYLKNGMLLPIKVGRRDTTIRLYDDIYSGLGYYYNWDTTETYNLMKQNDSGKVLIYEE